MKHLKYAAKSKEFEMHVEWGYQAHIQVWQKPAACFQLHPERPGFSKRPLLITEEVFRAMRYPRKRTERRRIPGSEIRVPTLGLVEFTNANRPAVIVTDAEEWYRVMSTSRCL